MFLKGIVTVGDLLSDDASFLNSLKVLNAEAGYCSSSDGCESLTHRLLGQVCQQILQKYNLKRLQPTHFSVEINLIKHSTLLP